MANNEHTWRERLQQAIAESGLTERSLSLKAGRAPGYVHGILKSGKTPSIDNFIELADVLGVSATWLILDIEMDADSERLLRVYALLNPTQKQHFLGMAESLASAQKENSK